MPSRLRKEAFLGLKNFLVTIASLPAPPPVAAFWYEQQHQQDPDIAGAESWPTLVAI